MHSDGARRRNARANASSVQPAPRCEEPESILQAESDALREEWNRAAAAVGIEVRMYEGTKHSAATGWLSSGMSLEMIQRMLRHRDSRSTERYAKLADQALVVAFSKTRKP